jgi:hypothetical protein
MPAQMHRSSWLLLDILSVSSLEKSGSISVREVGHSSEYRLAKDPRLCADRTGPKGAVW